MEFNRAPGRKSGGELMGRDFVSSAVFIFYSRAISTSLVDDSSARRRLEAVIWFWGGKRGRERETS